MRDRLSTAVRRRRARRWLPLAGLMLAVAALLVLTADDLGVTVDEARYLRRAESMRDYLAGSMAALRADDLQTPFSPDFIDYHFHRYAWLPGHPDFYRLVNAGFLVLAGDTLGPFAAVRLGTQVVFVLLFLPLWYGELRRRAGTGVALFFVVALCANGRVWHELHHATFDAPAMMMTWFALLALMRLPARPGACIAAAVLVGCALNTKSQTAAVPAALVLLALLVRDRALRRFAVAVVLLAPLVYWVGRPWLWHDPFGRMLATAQYARTWSQNTPLFGGHTTVPVRYLDTIWVRVADRGGPPWHYVPVMITATLPLFVTVLLPAGILVMLRRGGRARLLPPAVIAVFLAMLLTPGAPRYDGVRLYLVIWPLLYLVAAEGYVALRRRYACLRRPLARTGCLLLLAATVLQTASLRPYYEMYYSDACGGPAGAQRLGLETQYSGGCINREFIARYLKPLPPGTRLALLPDIIPVLRIYRDLGELRPDVVPYPASDTEAVVVWYREGYLDSAMPPALRATDPVRTETRAGVTVWELYALSPRVREVWAAPPRASR